MYKSIISLLLTLCFISSLTVPTFAFDNMEIIDNFSKIDIIFNETGISRQKISENEIPDDVTPLVFESIDEYYAFLELLITTKINSKSVLIVDNSYTNTIVVNSSGGSGNATLDSTSAGLATINLVVSATWANGKIVSRSVDASRMGVTASQNFRVNTKTSSVRSDGKTVDAAATGEVGYFICFNKFFIVCKIIVMYSP